MDATALFESAMELIKQRGVGGFAKEADLVRVAKTRMDGKIAEVGLPYRVAQERPLAGGRADLVIFGDGGSVLVAAEFKFEPAYTGTMASEDVVDWPAVEGDIAKIKNYVGKGGVGAAYAILVDADGRWRRRHPNPLAGSEWRDWGNGVWALWTKVGDDAAYKAPPAGGAPLPAEIAAGGRPLTEWDMSDVPPRARLNKTLVFPDGGSASLKTQGDLLVETTRWLWAKGRLASDKLPVPSGPIRYIVNTDPFHSNEGRFVSPKEVEGTPLVVETDTGDREEAVRFTIKLLEHCGIDPSSVLVR